MNTIDLEYIPKDFDKWEDIIYEFLIFLCKEKNKHLFSRVWAMMYGKGIIDENEKEDLKFEQKYFLPFAIAYDRALRRFCKKYDVNFKTAFGLSFASHQPLSSK